MDKFGIASGLVILLAVFVVALYRRAMTAGRGILNIANAMQADHDKLVENSTGATPSERDQMLRELRSEADTDYWNEFTDEELRFLTGRDKN